MKDKLERISGADSLKKYFDSEYIGAYSLDPGVEPILTIDSIWHGELTLAAGKKEHHVILKFAESTAPGVEEVKPLILNATNRKVLKKVYGSDSASVLEGKKIQLYIDPKVRDPQDGGFTEGLRIRPFMPKQDAPVICEYCKLPIRPASGLSALDIASKTKAKWHATLCLSCASKAKAEAEKAVDEAPAEDGAN